MVWPSQSAKLNSIEHFRNHLKQNLKAEKLKNKDELFEILQKK